MLYIVHCICFCKTFDRLLSDFRLTFGGLLTDFRRTFGGLLGLFELAFATTPAGYFSDEVMLYIVHCIGFCKTFDRLLADFRLTFGAGLSTYFWNTFGVLLDLFLN